MDKEYKGVKHHSFKHGMSKTRFYKAWDSMKARCLNPNDSCYSSYGGRGIHIFEEWKDFLNFKTSMYESYLNFSKINGESETTLDRIDVNGNYTPDNVRWATKKEQSRNRRLKVGNTSGVSGVVWLPKNKKWRASITCDGKRHHLGHFDSLDEAIKVRLISESKYWGSSYDL